MYTPIEKKVLNLIDDYKQDIVDLMQKLVQIPSFSGDEEEIGQFLLDEIKKFELDDIRIEQKTLDRPNVMARYRGTEGNPSITTYAHYDTVPLGDVTKWVHGPFSGTIEDGKIYGRGVSDHKFPISPLLFAVKAIKKAGLKLKGDIVFAFVCDEERGGHQGMKYVVDEGHCDTDYLLYSGGGGDGKNIGIAANGRAYYRITVKGRTAHTGRNDQGVNAAVKAMKLITHIEELREDVNNRRDKFKSGDFEIEGKARLSINLVNAFLTGNNVPDSCVIQIDRRFIPKVESFESTLSEVQAIVDKLKSEDPEFDAVVEFVPERWFSPSVSKIDPVLVGALQSSVSKVLEFTPEISNIVGGGSSDHAWFNLKYPDRPFVSYGCSGGGKGHTYDEYITIDGLIDNTKIYALFFMDLLGIA
jgi:acetylornithine deacetylase/succinyl-diaminopimelate desuccinylase family protein